MFGFFNCSQGNGNSELTSTAPASSGLSSTASIGDPRNPPDTEAIPQLPSAQMYETVGGTSCYQQQLVNGFVPSSLQFLQQQTIQQLYNNQQQVYGVVPTVHNSTQPIQIQPQHNHLQQVSGAFPAQEHFIFDEATSSTSAVQIPGSDPVELDVSAAKQISSLRKEPFSMGLYPKCDLCGIELKSKVSLEDHLSTVHSENSSGEMTSGQQQSVESNPNTLWCTKAMCGFYTENSPALAIHMEESHREHMEKVNLRMLSLREFFDWKNHLEETNKMNLVLSSATIPRTRPDCAHFMLECYRTVMLRRQRCRERPGVERFEVDMVEKALQGILVDGKSPQKEQHHKMDCFDETFNEIWNSEESNGKKRRRKASSSSRSAGTPCCAHINVQIDLINGTVCASGCLSHTGHDPEERVAPPPPSVLAKLKGMLMAGQSRQEIRTEMPNWTKHFLLEDEWNRLEVMSPANGQIFPHIKSLTKKIFEHICAITRFVNDSYWVDFMGSVADLLEAERRMKTVREAMEAKIEGSSFKEIRPKKLISLETELSYVLLSHGTNKHELKKFLKYGLDCADDIRFTDHRYQTDLSASIRSRFYDPSVSLFKFSPEHSSGVKSAITTSTPSRLHQRNVFVGTELSAQKNRKSRRNLIGSEDDSDYDKWSDEELYDILPRRCPPTASASGDRRLEKNLKRKKVPTLDLDPILKARMLALRAMALKQTDSNKQAQGTTQQSPTRSTIKKRLSLKTTVNATEARQAIKKGATKMEGKLIMEKAQGRKSKDKKKNHCDSIGERSLLEEKSCLQFHGEDQSVDRQRSIESIVIKQIEMERAKGKKPRIVKILTTQHGQTLHRQTTIVVEASPATPQTEQLNNMQTSSFRPGVSLLKTGGSVLRPNGPVSLLKPREDARGDYEQTINDIKGVHLLRTSNIHYSIESESVQDNDDALLQPIHSIDD